MIDFIRLDGPYGIPVYFQRMPAHVETVSLRWLVFTGSADDETVGAEGIYHWFEHLPSRGTKRYPEGYHDTERRLAEEGGSADAHTLPTHTAYYAQVPLSRWRQALDILTDMIAEPRLRPEDVDAERRIIQEELNEWLSSASDHAEYRLPQVVWKGHPLGHHPLGTRATIRSMSGDRLREAFEVGYGRSQVVLIVAGHLRERELLDEVDRWARYLPKGPPTERRTSTAYGPLPRWKKGEVTERPGPAGCVVYYLFPVEGRHADPPDRLAWHLLEELCEAGGLGSPLHELVREERQLVYSVGVDSALYPDGGYWGLAAETTPGKVKRVIGAFGDLLCNRELRSATWYDYVRGVIEAAPKMRGWAPDAFTEVAEERLTGLGAVWSDAEYLERLTSSGHQGLQTVLDRLTPEEAHIVIFRGK